MDLQAQMLIQYFIYLFETQPDDLDEKIVKAVRDYMIGVQNGIR